jgi:hypothetical protein
MLCIEARLPLTREGMAHGSADKTELNVTRPQVNAKNISFDVILNIDLCFSYCASPIAVVARSKVRNVFTRSNTGIIGSNPTLGMDVCVYSVFVLGSGLATC